MDPEELLEGLNGLMREFYSLRGIAGRFFGIRPCKRSPFDSALYDGFNRVSRHRYYRSLEAPQPLVSGPNHASFGMGGNDE